MVTNGDMCKTCPVHKVVMEQMNDKLLSIEKKQDSIEKKQDIMLSVQSARSSMCAERGVEINELKKDSGESNADSIRQWAAIDSMRRTIYIAMGGFGMLSAVVQIGIALWTKHQCKP